MTKEELLEKLREVAEQSGLSYSEIAEIFDELHSDFEILSIDEE